MKVSIITVTWNSEETLEETILSVISQTYHDIEFIVVDGMSTDNTKAIIEKYRDHISVFISEKDKGIYDAINKGIELATGGIIAILHSDDMYFNEQVIGDVVATMTKTQTDACYGNLVYVDRRNTSKVLRFWHSGAYRKNLFLKGWMPPHPAFFIKKWCYDQYGKYTLALKSSGDYELMLRMLHKHCVSVSYINKVLVKMRAGGTSNVTLKNRIRGNREDYKAWEMNGLKPWMLTLIRKPLSKLKQYLLRP
jgi:glycosyltransferase involved in cell wall biosynthesis